MTDNLLILLSTFIFSIPVAVVGFVYAVILTEEEMMFEKVKIFLSRLPNFIYLPLIGCYKCVTGQMALWLFIFLICPLIGIRYNFFLHCYFICQSILNAIFINYLYSVNHKN